MREPGELIHKLTRRQELTSSRLEILKSAYDHLLNPVCAVVHIGIVSGHGFICTIVATFRLPDDESRHMAKLELERSQVDQLAHIANPRSDAE